MNPTWKKQIIGTAAEAAAQRVRVYVVTTGKPLLAASLETARKWSSGLDARIVVLATQVVPYPLDLSEPPVTPDFAISRLGADLRELEDVEDVRVLLCRDEYDAVLTELAPKSLVVIGSQKRLWKTREEILAGRLRKSGHHVLLAYS